MLRPQQTEAGDVLTQLILTVFRVNNLGVTWGDRLVAPLGLTSARWQILGAIVAADRPQPVAWLARDLGANRQNIQRIVNDLEREGLVSFASNPHHRRAQLVVLTEKGQAIYDEAVRLYDPKVASLSDGLSPADVETALRIMNALKGKFGSDADGERP